MSALAIDHQEVTVAARAQIDVARLPALDPVRLRDRLVGDRVEGDAAVGGVIDAVALVSVLKLDGSQRHRAVDDGVWKSIHLRTARCDVAAEVGWSVLAGPMKLMYPAEAGSIGAREISRFHQLSGGKIGSGPGMAPPWMLPAATTLPSAPSEISAAITVQPWRRTIARVQHRCRAIATSSRARKRVPPSASGTDACERPCFIVSSAAEL
jgi:hypothetical protein